MRLAIEHATEYGFAQPVTLGPHLLLLRPRDGHDVRVLSTGLDIAPTAQLDWAFDAFGNSVCIARFGAATDHLSIVSRLTVETYAPTDESVAAAVQSGLFADRMITEPFAVMADQEAGVLLRDWVQKSIGSTDGFDRHALDQLSRAIGEGFTYQPRYVEGTQRARETVESGQGTCRDFAVLVIEAARAMGHPARFVTGYLHSDSLDPNTSETPRGGAAPHAWAEVFFADSGWVTADPTNPGIALDRLVRVGTTRLASQASPITGSFTGPAGLGTTLQVGVTVEAVAAAG